MQVVRIPPRNLNLLIIIAISLHFIIPIKILIIKPYSDGGIIFTTTGLFLNIWSTNHLRKRGALLEFDAIPQSLVTDGPFRINRNPICLGGVTLFIGLAITLGSLITFDFPLGLFLLLNQIYNPQEEFILKNSFPDQYRADKEKVKRWL